MQQLAIFETEDEFTTRLKNFETIKLYNVDNSGRHREWNIKVEQLFAADLLAERTTPVKVDEVGKITISTGLVDGKKHTQEPIYVTSGKNLGKANATTPYTQALAEAVAKIEQQLRSGYTEKIEDAKQGVLGSGIPQCMLAHKYHPTGAQKGSKTLDKMKLRGETIHVQPKYDGNRCLIKVNANEAVMYTRKGDTMPVQLFNIIEELKDSYRRKIGVTDTADIIGDIILDGELFSSELSFNELNGHLKRKDSQDPVALSKIHYHLYDVIVDMPYKKRYNVIKMFESQHVHVVPSHEIKATDENILEKLNEFLAEGHEGLMLRRLDIPYENKRSWQLVKVKLFEDTEFKIVDLEKDAMGRLGFFIMELDEPTADRDGKVITTFKAGISGLTHEEGFKMLDNKHKFIGKKATVEFFGRSEYGIPRFPKFKGVRED